MKIAKQSFTNLYASEVYRELERQAVKKGHFEPTPTDVVKLAAKEIAINKKVNHEIDPTPTRDLSRDLSVLVATLRRKGFGKQADDLEDKFVTYKKAETDLYNIKQLDKSNDLIDLAHPDGSVDIADKGELGEVETIQDAAKKILDVVNKKPTGKLASLADKIISLAQDADTDVETEMQGKVEAVVNPLITKIKDSIEFNNIKFPEDTWSDDIYNIYSKYSTVPIEKLNTYKSLKNIITKNMVVNISNFNIKHADLEQMATRLGINISTYITGVVANSTGGTPKYHAQNPNSIYYEEGKGDSGNNSVDRGKNNKETLLYGHNKSYDNIVKLVSVFDEAIKKLYTECFGEGNSKIKETTILIQNTVKNVFNPLNSMEISIENFSKNGVISLSSSVKKLDEIKSIISEIIKNKKNTELFNDINVILPGFIELKDKYINLINTLTKNVEDGLVKLTGETPSPLDNSDGMIKNLNEAYNTYVKILGRDDIPEKQKDNASVNKKNIINLIRIINKYKHSYPLLKAAVFNTFRDNLKMPDFIKNIDSIVNDARKASMEFGLEESNK